MVLNEHILERLFVQYIFKSNEVQLRTIAEIIQLFLKLNYGTYVGENYKIKVYTTILGVDLGILEVGFQ